MEVRSGPELSRYIDSSGRSKRRKSLVGNDVCSQPQREDDYMMDVDDQRQDLGGEPEHRWEGLAATVQNIGEFIFDLKDDYCQAPCFVKTSHSMDSSGGGGNRRTEAPLCFSSGNRPPSVTLPYDDCDQRTPASSSNLGAPQPPIRFPSVHLDMEDWDECTEDESAFLDMDAQPRTEGTSTASRQHQQQQSIYRTPSSISAAFSSPVSQFNQQTSNLKSKGNRQVSFGLYRSPAWSDEDETDGKNDDDDSAEWHDISPPNSPNIRKTIRTRGNSNDQRNANVIDVSQMENTFQGRFFL